MLATNGLPSLLARTRLLTVPIYDYAIMTEPLSRDQLENIRWVERHGINNSSREFHYYRRTADDRNLFGGFDAAYQRGGMIDMFTQLVAFNGPARGGGVAHNAGYRGLGVAATRFGAETMLDVLGGMKTERTELTWARSHPFPIQPEPVRYPAIHLMRRAVAKSDADGGEDGLLIRIADKFGSGCDS